MLPGGQYPQGDGDEHGKDQRQGHQRQRRPDALQDELDALPKETFDGSVFRATRQNLDPLASSFSGGRWMRKDGAGVTAETLATFV